MLAELQRMVRDVGAMLRGLDPSCLHPADAVALLDGFNALEKCAVAGRTLVADRAADACEWTRHGYRSPEAWLAAKTGTGYRDAQSTLGASAKLAELPALNESLRSIAICASRSESATESPASSRE